MIEMTEDYGAESIQVLEGLEAVRKRPGMYLGDPHDGSALHHCIWEVVDNSVDEHLAGHTSLIEVNLHKDGCVAFLRNYLLSLGLLIFSVYLLTFLQFQIQFLLKSTKNMM